MNTCVLISVLQIVDYDLEDMSHINVVWEFENLKGTTFDISFSFSRYYFDIQQKTTVNWETVVFWYKKGTRCFPKHQKKGLPDIPHILELEGYRCINIDKEPGMLAKALTNPLILEDEEE